MTVSTSKKDGVMYYHEIKDYLKLEAKLRRSNWPDDQHIRIIGNTEIVVKGNWTTALGSVNHTGDDWVVVPDPIFLDKLADSMMTTVMTLIGNTIREQAVEPLNSAGIDASTTTPLTDDQKEKAFALYKQDPERFSHYPVFITNNKVYMPEIEMMNLGSKIFKQFGEAKSPELIHIGLTRDQAVSVLIASWTKIFVTMDMTEVQEMAELLVDGNDVDIQIKTTDTKENPDY